jgi:PPK2 family polyphosphate:nucleotide phosphotransferase
MKDVRSVMQRLAVSGSQPIRLSDHDPAWTGAIDDDATAKELLRTGVRNLSELQEMLYAQNTHAVLVIFQAMDAAGKDGAIRHVLSGVNPQGCQVYSFKAPSAEERDHTYMWRSMKALPERGRIGIHNRSYYEEVLVVRVHREILAAQQLPEGMKGNDIWQRRFHEIREFEEYLANNGTTVIKFFLNVSKDEQRRRFLARIDEAEKNWKFSMGDVKERARWGDYMTAYEEMLAHTSTPRSPWYVIPADHKWFTRLAVASILCERIEDLDLAYPQVTEAKKQELEEARRVLLAESDSP